MRGSTGTHRRLGASQLMIRSERKCAGPGGGFSQRRLIGCVAGAPASGRGGLEGEVRRWPPISHEMTQSSWVQKRGGVRLRLLDRPTASSQPASTEPRLAVAAAAAFERRGTKQFSAPPLAALDRGIPWRITRAKRGVTHSDRNLSLLACVPWAYDAQEAVGRRLAAAGFAQRGVNAERDTGWSGYSAGRAAVTHCGAKDGSARCPV